MRILIAAATLLCAAAFAGSADAQTRFPLHCRAGGDMTINVLGQASGGGTELSILFRRSTRTTGLAPGECSWHDRVVNSREPSSFRIIFNARISTDFRPRSGRRAGDMAELYVQEGRDLEIARRFYEVLKSGGSFEVQAYNTGRAPMNAISFREVPAR